MDGIELGKLKEDVREGRIAPERLVDLVVTSQRELQEAKKRIAELEKQLAGGSKTVEEPYSVREEEKRQEKRGKKNRRRRSRPTRRGRFSTADKIALAVRTEQVFPEGVPQEQCVLSHTRPLWRLEEGRAVIVAYEVYRGPQSVYGKIPGALGRSEFGMEIIVAIAYQVYVVGLSFDKVCLLMNFFQGLKLRKSQVDALLNQLSRQWESEFETLCELLARSAVVHADETSWSINSVWAFLSEKVRLLFFGVHKDAATLARILNPDTFAGIVISDDAAVYDNFTHSQKCWAHFLRKAIKLTLLEPTNETYREFTDRLLEIYRAACRVQRDRRFTDAGRRRRVAELDDEILELCGAVWCAELPVLEGPADDYRRLCNELMRVMLNQQLFTFVLAAPVTAPNGKTSPVPGTNNEAEQGVRGSAMDRSTGRTSKTVRGSRRRTVIDSVLQSLRKYLVEFTLASVVKEIGSWKAQGRSCFKRLLDKLKRTSKRHAETAPTSLSVLDALLPIPGD